MRLGIKAHLYNYVMRDARQQLGWTQQQLAEECGWTHPNHIVEIEGMKMPKGRPSVVREKLYKISNALCIPFNELFPQEYLNAIQQEKLPRRKTPYEWCVEVPLEPLLDSWDNNRLMITSGDELDEALEREELKKKIGELLIDLPDRQREVLERRYGLNGYEPLTLEGTAQAIGIISRERVRQIEANALKKLRHPRQSRELQDYRHCPGYSNEGLTDEQPSESLDAESYDWLLVQHPLIAEVVEKAVSFGHTPDEIKEVLTRHTGNSELADRCQQAARWLSDNH